jgi:phasin family protein
MAKPSMTDTSRQFSEQNAERVAQAANFGMDWIRHLTEHGLDQSKVVLEGFLTAARSSVDTLDQHAAELRERSLSMAAETVTNSFDFAHQLLRAREPQHLLQLQSEFLSRQAQALAAQARELGETISHGASEIGRNTAAQMQATTEAVRRRAES